MDARDARIVLVHDWLTGMRGGEKCLEILCRHWPRAPLFSLFHKRGAVSEVIENRALWTSFLGKLPGVYRYYRYLLPLMPAAVSSCRLPACDLVVSLSHCVAKGVCSPPGVPHICYCFTPMRYAWHQRGAYFGPDRTGRVQAAIIDHLLEKLRDWDRRTSDHVTHFVAISRTVQARIRECYGRASDVIYPPADTDFFSPGCESRGDHYLVVSALAPYKRVDLAISACNRLKRKLLIIGDGQDEKRLRSLAGPTIHFLGWQPNLILRKHLRTARALLFPGEEDFGIVPVEAMACGTPVIAFARGGATETISPVNRPPTVERGSGQPTGVWFDAQTAESLMQAIEMFEREGDHIDPAASRRQALNFGKKQFEQAFFAYVQGVLDSKLAERRRAA